MTSPVNWSQILVTSAVTLSVPLVAHAVTGRKSKASKALGQLRDLSETVKNLPDDHPSRVTLLGQADILAAHYARTSVDQLSIKRDPAGIALGVALALAGANLGVFAVVPPGIGLWWLALAIPLFIIGMFGATYEATGGKNRRQSSSGQSEQPSGRQAAS